MPLLNTNFALWRKNCGEMLVRSYISLLQTKMCALQTSQSVSVLLQSLAKRHKVNVFDVNGRLISSIINGFMTAGSYEVEWNGVNQPSGIYLVKLSCNGIYNSHKVMLVK